MGNDKRVDHVLFAYGGRIEQTPSGDFYGNELNDTVANRYLKLGKSVTFVVRKRPILENEAVGLSRFQLKGLTLVTLPDYAGVRAYLTHSNDCKRVVGKCVEGCDILIARVPSSVGYWAIEAAKRLNKPYMVEVVGCVWDALWNHSFLGRLVAPYSFFRLRKNVKEAPFVLYVTRQFLQKRYPSNGIQIGVSDVIIPEADSGVLGARLGRISSMRQARKLTVGTIAGLDVPYKGQETVLGAIALLKAQGWEITYKVVGKGSGDKLVQTAQEFGILSQLKVIGQLPHEKVFSFLDELDVYIQPSRQEGMPRALIEAMSRACPCIGAQVGGIPELLKDEFCFKTGSIKGLARMLMKLSLEGMAKMASENFMKSKEFGFSELERQRDKFYHLFLNRVTN